MTQICVACSSDWWWQSETLKVLNTSWNIDLKFSQGKKTPVLKGISHFPKMLNQKSHNERLDSNQSILKSSHLLCTGQLYLSLHLKKKKVFSLPFWCSEEHAFSASSEFRGDFRWVARPHSLITRSKTPAGLQDAPRGIKPPPARASSGPTCQDTINSYCCQLWTVPIVQLSSLVLIFCPYLHNINLVCNGLLGEHSLQVCINKWKKIAYASFKWRSKHKTTNSALTVEAVREYMLNWAKCRLALNLM